MRIKTNLKRKFMPFAMAVVLSATSMPMYMTQTAIVKAATASSFGTEATELKAGTYTVPLALKNASDITKASMAAGAIGENGILTVDESGKATLEVTLQELKVMGITGAAGDFQVYQGNDTKSEKQAAQILTKDETTGNPTKVKFEIPDITKTADGVYVSMYIDAMKNNVNAFLKIDYASLGGNNSSSDGVKEKTISISQFGGYDIKTVVTYKDDKVTDLAVTGENFKGKFAKQNENDYLPKAVNKIKDQVVGLNIKDQTAFDKVDTVSGATTSATAIKNAAMEALGLTPKQEILAEAPETVKAGTYEIQMKNVTDIVDHSLSAADHDKKVTATLKVDENGKMTLSYPVISNTVTEPLEVLGFNGYYNGSILTKDGVEVTSDDEGIVTNVNMSLTGAKPQQTYKANFKLYVPSMANLNGTYDEIEINNGKFNSDATITLYWDTLKEVKDQIVLADGIYKVDAKMLRADGTGSTSMTDKAITHKVKLTVKDGKYYVTLNFKGIEVFGEKGYVNKVQYLDGDKAKDVTVNSVQKYTDGKVVKDDYGTNYPDLVTFPMTDEAVKYSVVPMQVYVAIMENMTPGSGTQKVNLSLDLSSAVKTTANDKDFNSEDVIESAKVTAPQTPAGVKAASADHDKVKVTWNKVSQAAGYEVYQNSKKIADVKTNSYTKTKLTTGTKYTYKVRAYKLNGTKKVYSGYSKNVTATPNLSTVTSVKVKNSSKKSAKITIKKVNGASGYVIYRATKKNGKYKAVSTLKKGTAVSYTNKKLKKKSTYYYKVRAYKKVGKKTVYGAYSKTVSVKIKK